MAPQLHWLCWGEPWKSGFLLLDIPRGQVFFPEASNPQKRSGEGRGQARISGRVRRELDARAAQHLRAAELALSGLAAR